MFQLQRRFSRFPPLLVDVELVVDVIPIDKTCTLAQYLRELQSIGDFPVSFHYILNYLISRTSNEHPV